jgi:signal transduction histidine kinase
MLNSAPKSRILSVNQTVSGHLALKESLGEIDSSMYFKRATSGNEFQECLEFQSWSLVICTSEGTELLPHDALFLTKRYDPDLPFLLISNGIGEDEVAHFMKLGAEDVLFHPKASQLNKSVERILRDSVTKRKQAISNKIAEEAFAAREQMIAIVSHDIKNPLSIIQLEAQMLLKMANQKNEKCLTSEVHMQAQRILKTTEKMKRLISDLLDRKKTEYGLSTIQKSDIRFANILNEVLDLNRRTLYQKRIKTDIKVQSESVIQADRNKIFQVLTNLLSNAIKFSPECGQVLMTVEEGEQDLTFSIKDNGPGLKVSDLKNVFQKYWTGGIPGRSETGLGLFICKTIIEAHGGQIYAENIPDSGARFWFTIPKKTFDGHFHIPKKDKNKKILIIDDDEDLREVLGWILEGEGFSVQSYGDPLEAIEDLENERHIPQFMVVDFQMDKMLGSDFLRHKRELKQDVVKNCPVIMISSSPDEVLSDIHSMGNIEMMSKPLDLSLLTHKIKHYLASEFKSES